MVACSTARHVATVLPEGACSPPPGLKLLDCKAVEDVESPRDIDPATATTLKLRNLPNSLNAEDIMAAMVKLGYQGTYDFLFVPMDAKQRHNAGYAFVNFLNADLAIMFTHSFKSYRFPGAAKKRCRATLASVQGKYANEEVMVLLDQ
mmetsp:Transcript_7970/g.18808  ORF Transcript_7970/g.18808 Transcript_7970/m.18808 type:complete len:148 (+) Transcript_7970:61-504(+)